MARTDGAIEEDGVVTQRVVHVLLLQHLSKAQPLKPRPSARGVARVRRLGALNHAVGNINAAVRGRRRFAGHEEWQQESVAAANLPSNAKGAARQAGRRW